MNKIKIGLYGYSKRNGGAANALSRWISLLRTSSVLKPIEYIFEEADDSAMDRLTLKVSKAVSKIQIGIGSKLDISDGGNLSLNILPNPHVRYISSDLDFLNIHWFHGEMVSIAQLKRIKTRKMWTLHDPWLFNGIGHYEQLKSDSRNKIIFELLNSFQLYRKKDIVGSEDILVAPSQWIADIAQSKLGKSQQIEVIPNPLPLQIFQPTSRIVAKEKVGLDPNIRHILVGSAADPNDSRKGFDLAFDVLDKIKGNFLFEVISIGYGFKAPLGVRHKSLGYIHDPETLNTVYCAADITLVPSRHDNLPQIMTESIAAGTAVAGFAVGGLKETLMEANGIISNAFDTSDLATKISMYLSGNARLQQDVSDFARRKWNDKLILKMYENLVLKAFKN